MYLHRSYRKTRVVFLIRLHKLRMFLIIGCSLQSLVYVRNTDSKHEISKKIMDSEAGKNYARNNYESGLYSRGSRRTEIFTTKITVVGLNFVFHNINVFNSISTNLRSFGPRHDGTH